MEMVDTFLKILIVIKYRHFLYGCIIGYAYQTYDEDYNGELQHHNNQ